MRIWLIGLLVLAVGATAVILAGVPKIDLHLSELVLASFVILVAVSLLAGLSRNAR